MIPKCQNLNKRQGLITQADEVIYLSQKVSSQIRAVKETAKSRRTLQLIE